MESEERFIICRSLLQRSLFPRMPLYQESSIKSIRFEDRLIGKISSLHLGMDSVQLPTTLTTRGLCLGNEVQTCRPMSIILRDDFTSRHADKL